MYRQTNRKTAEPEKLYSWMPYLGIKTRNGQGNIGKDIKLNPIPIIYFILYFKIRMKKHVPKHP